MASDFDARGVHDQRSITFDGSSSWQTAPQPTGRAADWRLRSAANHVWVCTVRLSGIMLDSIRLQRKDRERALAVGSSLVIHALALALLTPWTTHRSPGMPGTEIGAGIEVTLVSAPTLGIAAPQPPPMNAMETATSSPPPASVPEKPQGSDEQGPLAAADDRQVQPLATSASKSVAWASTSDSNVSATLDGTRRGAAESAGGNPRSADELLVQIARCLPGTLRPHLWAQRLILKLDANGALADAPTIDSTMPMLTAADRAAADRVVQAALQCGPYRSTAANPRVVALAVDFSGVGAGPVALTQQ